MMTRIGISWSEMSRWLRCPRFWFIEYFLGYLPASPSPAGARNIGLRIHTALEAFYGYELDPLLVLDVLYGIELEADDGTWEKELRADYELSKIMVEGYLEWVKEEGIDARMTVVETESELRVPLPGFADVDLRAKLDQVVRDDDTGYMYFRDHKSAQDFERTELIEIDGQMLTYNLMAWLKLQETVPTLGQPLEVHGDRPLVMGGEVNTLRKVKRTRNSKPPYYQRHTFRYSPGQLAAHLATVQQVVGEIMNARWQLNQAYAAGGLPEQVNWIQAHLLRPVMIITDCSWRCHLSKGMCQMMSDGTTNWMDALVGSGAYVQGDPYARYTRGGLQEVRARLAAG